MTLDPALVVAQPSVLNATVTQTNVTCNGDDDGTITLSSPTGGGYGTYEYSINGGTSWQSTGTYTGLAPATYDIRIRDAANTACEIILNGGLEITEPVVLELTPTADVLLDCNGDADGSGGFSLLQEVQYLIPSMLYQIRQVLQYQEQALTPRVSLQHLLEV